MKKILGILLVLFLSLDSLTSIAKAADTDEKLTEKPKEEYVVMPISISSQEQITIPNLGIVYFSVNISGSYSPTNGSSNYTITISNIQYATTNTTINSMNYDFYASVRKKSVTEEYDNHGSLTINVKFEAELFNDVLGSRKGVKTIYYSTN